MSVQRWLLTYVRNNKVSLCAAYRSLGCEQFTGGVHRQETLEEGGSRRVSAGCVGVSVGVWVCGYNNVLVHVRT